MRHQTIAGFAALMALALVAAGAVAIAARQSDDGSTGNNAASLGIEGYRLRGTIGGPMIPTTPIDVAVDATGRIFVADVTLNRVLAFTPDWTLDLSWGDGGMSEQLTFPAGLAIGPEGSLYVLQLGGGGVYVLDSNGNERDFWQVEGDQGLASASVPTGIAIDHLGTIYIPDQRSQQIRRYTTDGEELEAWNLTHDRVFPRDIAEWNDRILLSYEQPADTGGGGFLAFDLDGNEAPLSDLPFDAPESGVLWPGSIAVGPRGQLAVLFLAEDGESSLISTSEGSWEPSGDPAIVAVNGLVPPGIAWDESGQLLLADSSHQRVRVFSAGGAVAGDIQSPSKNGLLAGLDEIVIGSDGLIYAADPLLGRVTAFRPGGGVETIFQLQSESVDPLTTGFTRQRMRIAVDDGGSVYAIDETTGRISKFGRHGELIDGDWAGTGDPEQPLVALMLAAGSNDHLYLVNINAQDEVQVFNSDGEHIGPVIEPLWEGAVQDIVVADNVIYTVELGAGTSSVRSFSTDGDYLGELADLSHGDGNSNRTGFALAVDPTNGLLIAAVNVLSGPEFEYQILRMTPDGDLDRIGTLDVPYTTVPDIAVSPTGVLYLASPNEQLIYVYDPVE